ncbi:hypothetical protein ACJIZ3_019321 [Penstemon smallii]|uniref:Glycosyltransferase family 92 protein n=1 Tax=Penstemon smallii TaxID=265156 RepID=A0ABD3T0U9_9LAMI
MARHIRTTFLYVVASIVFCASLYHHYLRDAIAPFPPSPAAILPTSSAANYALHENLSAAYTVNNAAAIPTPPPISTTAVLIPDWQVLVILSPEITTLNLDGDYFCLYDTNEVSPARFSGLLHFPDRATFCCLLPVKARRRFPLLKQPMLLKSPENPPARPPPPLLLRWTFLVYDSLTTDNDVVLFVKGVNIRQGINRLPSEFNCVFGDDVINSVRTAVTTSMQEVFRCQRPNLTAVSSVKVSLEIVAENRVVPSVAYYSPAPRKLEYRNGKSLLCASTMVYDVAKFLKEWVLYHSKIGVEKFLLYDNGSDDDLGKVVNELVKEGFDISTYFWLWPKTQEGGFSHGAIYARDACTWMMFIDVDEFVYSPSWINVSQPSKSLLHTLITSNSTGLGQISIGCHEFGPSGQKVHPVLGVTQGYNCRKVLENRHKSIVLLEAVDDSLLNVIHHFILKPEYIPRNLDANDMVVNHYKYQAWPEFKAKFRRRVSAYVLDWTQKLNPNSNDRTPGLGFSPVEPEGWPQKFCEVYDNNLKDLTLKWFGKKTYSGYQMAWQR